MEKFMRNAPVLIVIVVMSLQVPRVSSFGDRIGVNIILAVIFALFLTFSTFVLSFFQGRTDNYQITASVEDKKSFAAQKKMERLFKDVNRTATLWLILFIGIEGFLNLSETMTEVETKVVQFTWEWFGAGVYGLFPTLAAWGMGNIQALVSKIPHGAAGGGAMERTFNAFMRWMENAFDAQTQNANASETHRTHGAKKGKRNADAYPKKCPHCPEMLTSSNAYSAHMRWKHGPQSAQPIGFVASPVNKSTTTTSGEAVEAVKSAK